MSQYNFPSGCVLRELAPIAAAGASIIANAVDVRDLEGPMLIMQSASAGTGVGATLDGKLQDSTDGVSNWFDVDGAAFAQVTDTAAAQKLTLNANATRGFVRYVGTINGTTPSFALGVILAAMRRRTG